MVCDPVVRIVQIDREVNDDVAFCNDRVIGNDSVFAIVKDSGRPVIYVIVDVHYPGRAHIELGFAYAAGAYAPGGEADRNQRDIT